MGKVKPKIFVKFAILVYNQTRNRKIMERLTVAQSETNNQLKNLTDYRLSYMAVVDGFFVTYGCFYYLCMLMPQKLTTAV